MPALLKQILQNEKEYLLYFSYSVAKLQVP